MLLKQYTPAYPDVKRLKKKIEDEEAQIAATETAIRSGCGPRSAASANENRGRSGSAKSTSC